MFNFKYDIEINTDGRPYITPVDGTEKEMSFVEHKFMALEMARSVVTSTIDLHEENPKRRPLPPEELERLKHLEREITRLGNIFAVTIKEQFELFGIADRLINKNFDISVLTLEERDGLNYNGIIYDDQIFTRKEGLRVKVIQTGQVFELQGGVDNEHWKEI